MGLFRKPLENSGPENALPGRDRNASAKGELCERTTYERPLLRPPRTSDLWDGVLLGRGAQILGDGRCIHHRRGLRRWRNPQPDLPRGVCSGYTGHTEVVLDSARSHPS